MPIMILKKYLLIFLLIKGNVSLRRHFQKKSYLKIVFILKAIHAFKIIDNLLECVNRTEKMSHVDSFNLLSTNSIGLSSYGGIFLKTL
jgi:hypothetical protein